MSTYSLFNETSTSSSVAGPSTAIAYGSDIVVGFHFYVTESTCFLNGYWWWVAPSGGTTTSGQKFALWNVVSYTSQVYVTGSSVAAGTLSPGWNFIELPTPLQLTQNADYVAATGGATINFCDTGSQFGSGDPYNGASSGPLIAVSEDNPGWQATGGFMQNGLYYVAPDPTLTCPITPDSSGDGWSNFWMDVEIQTGFPAFYDGTYRIWPSYPTR